MPAEVAGLERFRDGIQAAVDTLGNLEPLNTTAAGVIAARARTTAPRRRGWLAASVTASGEPTAIAVTAGDSRVDYAIPVHAVNPFIARAAYDTEREWLDTYEDELNVAVLDPIRGS